MYYFLIEVIGHLNIISVCTDALYFADRTLGLISYFVTGIMIKILHLRKVVLSHFQNGENILEIVKLLANKVHRSTIDC